MSDVQAGEIREERPPKPGVQPREPIPPDTVLVGIKPIMAYATAVMMHFQTGASNLTLKARGRAISRAVDVVEVVRRRFFSGKIAVKEITIGTQSLGGDGEMRNVSTIEIKIEKTT